MAERENDTVSIKVTDEVTLLIEGIRADAAEGELHRRTQPRSDAGSHFQLTGVWTDGAAGAGDGAHRGSRSNLDREPELAASRRRAGADEDVDPHGVYPLGCLGREDGAQRSQQAATARAGMATDVVDPRQQPSPKPARGLPRSPRDPSKVVPSR